MTEYTLKAVYYSDAICCYFSHKILLVCFKRCWPSLSSAWLTHALNTKHTDDIITVGLDKMRDSQSFHWVILNIYELEPTAQLLKQLSGMRALSEASCLLAPIARPPSSFCCLMQCSPPLFLHNMRTEWLAVLWPWCQRGGRGTASGGLGCTSEAPRNTCARPSSHGGLFKRHTKPGQMFMVYIYNPGFWGFFECWVTCSHSNNRVTFIVNSDTCRQEYHQIYFYVIRA